MSWGFGLFLAAIFLANFSPAAAVACLGVVVMVGLYASHTVASLEQRADEARTAETP